MIRSLARALAVRFWQNAGGRPIIATMLAACVAVGAVTTAVGFIGLSGGGFAGVIISVGLALLVSTAAAVTLARAVEAESWPERIGWVGAWAFAAFISVTTAYAFWFSLTSSGAFTDRTARDAAREATIPLTTFASDYSLLGEKTAALRDLSAAKAKQEFSNGGTCEAGIGPTEGPRRRLRARDAEEFGQYAQEFARKRADIEQVMEPLDQLYRDSGPGFYAKASVTLEHAYAASVSAAEDPNLAAFKTFLVRRIADGHRPITDPQSGQTFTCDDPELEASMQAAQAVALPPAPAKPPAIAEPTLVSAAGRPFVLIAHPAQFSLDLDVRPLLLGILIDFLQAVFVIALRSGRSAQSAPGSGRPRDRAAGDRFAEKLRGALARNRWPGRGPQSVGWHFTETGSWLRVLDRHTICLPRRRKGSDDYLLAPQAEDPESLQARGLAVFLRAAELATLHQVTLRGALPPRWQDRLGDHLHQNVQIEVYRLSDGLLNELLLDAASSETAPPKAAHPDEPGRARTDDPTAFDDAQLGMGL
jgi:hypothetical protein